MLGCYNAASIAVLYENNKMVATCLDTPNNIAAGFKLFPNATHVKVPNMNLHFAFREDYFHRQNGLNMDYHKKFISAVPERCIR